MKNIILLLFILTGLPLAAQSVDMERMNRDIEVAENVLSALLQENRIRPSRSEFLLLGGAGGVEGSYLEGFGVLFTISGGSFPAALNLAYTIRADERRALGYAPAAPADRERDRKAEADTISMEPYFREVATRFLADYAFTLRQLPDKEKIMIRYGNSLPGIMSRGEGPALVYRLTDGVGSRGGYSAMVKKSDVSALQSGSINREQFEKRIEFTTKSAGSDEADRDLVLLSGIFARLYKSDMSEDFALFGTPGFEQIPGLGAVFYLPMRTGRFTFSSNGVTLWRWAPPAGTVIATTPDKMKDEDKDEDEEEEDQAAKLEEAYPAFLKELKQNIVEYGGIVKNLTPGEALIFRVELPNCPDCEKLPKKVEITARQSTLEAYRRGTTTLEAAAGQLKVVEE